MDLTSSSACRSSVRWSNLIYDETKGLVSVDRLSLFNCTEKTTWGAWSDGESLVQGFIDTKHAGEYQYMLNAPDDGENDDHQFEEMFFRLLGPLISFLLCAGSFIYLYSRRDRKRFRGDNNIALAEHPSIPLSARIAVPVILFSTVGLFAFSNASIGAKVTMSLTMFDKNLMEQSLFDFSLINTVTDMWDAGVYPLSALVAIWSGIWPYFKSLLMLSAWFFPPSILHAAHRRRLLIALDILGKWALIG